MEEKKKKRRVGGKPHRRVWERRRTVMSRSEREAEWPDRPEKIDKKEKRK